METASNAERIKITAWISLAVNISLSLLKIVCGVAGSSQVVVADGVHSLSDIIADISIIAGVAFWSKPPDTKHPYGHRRIETFVTLFIAAVLVLTAAGLTLKAFLSLNGARDLQPGLVAVAAVLISIIAKEWVFRLSLRVGKKKRIPVLSCKCMAPPARMH